jgi:hypothetical protein
MHIRFGRGGFECGDAPIFVVATPAVVEDWSVSTRNSSTTSQHGSNFGDAVLAPITRGYPLETAEPRAVD